MFLNSSQYIQWIVSRGWKKKKESTESKPLPGEMCADGMILICFFFW